MDGLYRGAEATVTHCPFVRDSGFLASRGIASSSDRLLRPLMRSAELSHGEFLSTHPLAPRSPECRWVFGRREKRPQ